MGLSNELSCEAWSFSCHLNPHRCFQSETLRLYFPAGTLDCVVCLASPLFLPVYPHMDVGLPTPPATTHLSASPPHLGCPSPPLLPVCMNVSSLTPCLLDFHTVQFSGSSGYFLFLNLLLSFFWLCEEAQCVYLHLYLGWKSTVNYF